jgi:hydrogenase-4 transcriptional activator
MARHFAERAATRFGLPLQLPTPREVAALVAYPWPGNVRELATVMDRAAILGNGDRLEITKALGVMPDTLPVAPSAVRTADSGVASAPAVAPLDEAVRRHIEVALAAAGGRIEGPQGAARMLRVNPHTLRARMRKLGVEWSRFRG